MCEVNCICWCNCNCNMDNCFCYFVILNKAASIVYCTDLLNQMKKKTIIRRNLLCHLTLESERLNCRRFYPFMIKLLCSSNTLYYEQSMICLYVQPHALKKACYTIYTIIYKPTFVYTCELMLVSRRNDCTNQSITQHNCQKNAWRTLVTRREQKSQAHMAYIMKPRQMTEQQSHSVCVCTVQYLTSGSLTEKAPYKERNMENTSFE